MAASSNSSDFQKLPRGSRPGTPRREQPSQSRVSAALPVVGASLPAAGDAGRAFPDRSATYAFSLPAASELCGTSSNRSARTVPAQRPGPVGRKRLRGDQGEAPPIQLQLGDRVHPSIQQRLKLPSLTSVSALPALDASHEIGCELRLGQKPPLPPTRSAQGSEASGSSAMAPWPDSAADWMRQEPELQDSLVLSRPQSASAVLSEGPEVERAPPRLVPTVPPPLTPSDMPRRMLGNRAARFQPEPETPMLEVAHAPREASPDSRPRRCEHRMARA